MNKIESFIRDCMRDGMCPEDIAESFTEVLNNVEKTTKEEKARKEEIAACTDDFAAGYMHNGLDHRDVGNVAVMVYASEHPEWTAKDIKLFHNTIVECCDFAAKTVGKDSKVVLDTMLSDMTKDIEKMFKNWQNKTREEKKENTDDEVIKNFIKRF